MKAHPQLWRSLALIVVAAVLLVCGIFVSRVTDASLTSNDIETPTGRQLMEFDDQRVVKPDASTTMEKSIEQRQSSSSILRELLADKSVGSGETIKTPESLARESRYRGLERIEDDPFIYERRMKKSKMKSASQRAAAPTATAATPRPAPTSPTRTPVVVNAPTSVIILGSKKAKASKKAKIKKGGKGAKARAPTGPAGRNFKSSSAKAYVYIR